MVTLFACGDVMPGRGIDQILPHPGDPELREDYASDADAYVRLAVRANGPIPRPAGFSWPWGDALPVIEDAAPDVRIINLETSVTRNADFAPARPEPDSTQPRPSGPPPSRYRTAAACSSSAAGPPPAGSRPTGPPPPPGPGSTSCPAWSPRPPTRSSPGPGRVEYRPDGRLIVHPLPGTPCPWLDRVAQLFGLPHP
jgi:hypothetical protein